MAPSLGVELACPQVVPATENKEEHLFEKENGQISFLFFFTLP